MSKQLIKIQENIDTLKLNVSELEQRLGELEIGRRMAILERDSTAKEAIRKRHIDVSFELLQTKDKIREFERKQRELQNKSVSEAKQKEANEIQTVRKQVLKRFAPAFKRIEKLRSSLNG